MIAPGIPESEIAKAGRKIFDQKIKQTLRPEHDGQLIVIDTVSGEYEIASDDVQAVTRLSNRCDPGAFYFMRIGQPVVYRIGTS